MLPRHGHFALSTRRRPHGVRALTSAVLAATLLVSIAPFAQANDSGWTSSNWTGVVGGPPAPGVGLPAAPLPTNPAPVGPIADIAPTYEGQATCDPTIKPGAQRAADLIKATYGATQTVWIPRGCDVGDQSEHKEGRALDWMTDVRKAQERSNAETFLQWLLGPDAAGVPYGNAMRMGVMYIGWNDRIWRGYDVGRGWTELKGCFSKPDPGSDTVCHRNHIHISFTWDGAAGTTSMWTGNPITAPYCPRASSGASTKYPEARGELISVGPVRVLDTRAALGLAQRCRLQQDRWTGDSHRLFPKITGVGGIPPNNVGSVRVRVTAQGSNAKASVRVWSPGQDKSQQLFEVGMNSDASAETTVPVSTDGTIAIATSTGATDIVVEVLGYYRADATGAVAALPTTTSGSTPMGAVPIFTPVPNASPAATKAPEKAPAQTITPASPPPLEPEPTDFQAVGSVVGFETTSDAPIQAGESRTISLAGLPATARSAVVFVTTKEAQKRGFLRIGRSTASESLKVKFPKTAMKKAVMIVPVNGSDMTVSASPSSAVQIRVELLGFGTSDTPPTVIPMDPKLMMKGTVDPAKPLIFQAARKFNLPGMKRLKAVLLRVQTRKATADGTLAVFASDGTAPGTRSAPVMANAKYAALVLAPVGADGKIQVSSTVATHFIATLVGYVK
ncbi:unannotated protein [freshwater metagenome]|uniref:Unannotated protein n=1 Tax=freshwater metagenome TaxID=449393 RepID=A0A6J6KUY5_9ZZZZ|nr:hypothetical protein [Actinomycetota bacterium]